MYKVPWLVRSCHVTSKGRFPLPPHSSLYLTVEKQLHPRPTNSHTYTLGESDQFIRRFRVCGFVLQYNRALLVPVLTDLTSLLTTSRQTGVHLPTLQPSAGQFFASLDPINEASTILGPLNTNSRNSVQHQFQDTFPGTNPTS